MALYCNSATLSAQNINIDTVEVNARRLSESERAAAPMQALQRQELERMGVSAVSDAVKHMSGVQVKDYGGIGGLKTISVRSLGAQHTAVMYDGVAVSDCQTGQVDLSRYAIDNVENLTLTIGQSDNIFQSANRLPQLVCSISTPSMLRFPLLMPHERLKDLQSSAQGHTDWSTLPCSSSSTLHAPPFTHHSMPTTCGQMVPTVFT